MIMIKKISVMWMPVLGAAIIALAHMKYGVGFLAWIGYAPMLYFLKEKKGVWYRVLLFFVMTLAWSLTTFKIISPPIPWFFAFLFSPVIAFFHIAGILVWDFFKESKYHYLIFPGAMMISEWVMYTFTPFASWGAAAYSQVDNLVLLQSVSLYGMMGLSFLLYLVNALVMMWFDSKPLKESVAIAAVVSLVLFYGHLRVGFGQGVTRSTVKVAAIGSTSNLKFVGVPEDARRERVKKELFERTRKAAENNVKLIVWPEGSTLVFIDEEAKLKADIADFAKNVKTDIVAGYIMVNRPFDGKYFNKYIFAKSDGAIDHQYNKHRPVVGEPTEKGNEPQKTVERSYGNVSGAICYDYDYPSLALEHGRLGADIIALPSNDWKGIDPVHTQMASLRAIENGFSVVRSAQFGLTAAIDPYGKVMGQFSDSESDEKILISEVPNRKIWTLFGFITDWTVIGIGVLVIVFGIVYKKPDVRI
jgi:apolipoprotein N-acyltransferase